MDIWQSKDDFRERFERKARELWGRLPRQLNANEVYQTVAGMVVDLVGRRWRETNDRYDRTRAKQVYYFSIEFLLGRLLESNLMGTGMEDICRAGLAELGWNLDDVFPAEPEPGLGNGGLGRLAACFIDSLAALSYPGHGCSLRYRYGLFRQKVEDGRQEELPDDWLAHGFPWETRKETRAVTVRFGGRARMRPDGRGGLTCAYDHATEVKVVPYDVPVIGYHNDTVNTLRLWQVEEARGGDPAMAEAASHVCDVLYPDDSTVAGKRLRLMQEYVLVSAGVQSVIRHYKSKLGGPLTLLPKYVALHINDTHPALMIPELMRILMDEEGLTWEDAWNTTAATCAYTNHTVLPEALERWSIPLFQELLPRPYQIVDEINRQWLQKVRAAYPGDEWQARSLALLWDGEVHMARLSALGSHSVNGVSEIHTGILTKSTLRPFYDWFPQRFSNKTNGVTHRRWLIQANPQLSALLDETIGEGWRRDPERLQELESYAADPAFRERLAGVKRARKDILARYIREHTGISVDVDSIFDVQIKRIHMYKRQLLNILHVLARYLALKDGGVRDMRPQTWIFGGKAAKSYREAKETIRLICAVADLVNRDPAVSRLMKVVFLENYNVSLGQLVFPAADVSEQISTAGKEASGTGNMKFMMNGAITLGTEDGANVEIHRAVGDANCVIFGLSAEEAAQRHAPGAYSSLDMYRTDPVIHRLVDALTDGTLPGEPFVLLRRCLLDWNDEFLTLADFEAYRTAQEEIRKRYTNRDAWLTSSAINIARSGWFSSDRTIRQYAEGIWDITPQA